MKEKLIFGLKSAIVGATMLIPGVSGGTMAMMLGIYRAVISALNTLRSRKNLLLMALFLGGGALGMFLFARPLSHLSESYPLPLMYFFAGAVAGSVPVIVKKAQVRSVCPGLFFFPILGVLAVLGLSLLPEGILAAAEGGLWGIFLLFAAGLLAALALILPGISVSYMLLLLGVYDRVMLALTSFEFGALLPLFIGIILGVLLFARLLEFVLNKYPRPSYLVILGFILGSVAEIFPGIPTGIYLLLCPLCLLAGFFALYFLSKWNTD